MPTVSEAAKLYTPADRVWNTLREFTAIGDWHPALLHCEPGLEGSQSVRRLDIAAGEPIVERLDDLDDAGMVQAYSMQSGPLPVSDYKAVLRVHRDDATSCTVEWTGTFEAPEEQRDAAVAAIREFYRKGLDHLRFTLGA